MEDLVNNLRQAGIKAIPRVRLEAFIEELIENETLKKAKSGKWNFYNQNLPENYGKVANGTTKIIKAIKSVCEKVYHK